MAGARKLKFRAVMMAVHAERRHQDVKYGTIEDRGVSVEEYIEIVERELVEAKDGLAARRDGRHSARHELLQVAATCIAALEAHGLPEGA